MIPRNKLPELLRQLHVETDGLWCLECGYEQGCSLHGCRILREAAEEIEALRVQVQYLEREEKCNEKQT